MFLYLLDTHEIFLNVKEKTNHRVFDEEVS